MQIINGLNNLPSNAGGTVVALGNFDGFHRGHHVVVGEAGREARRLGVPLTVVVMEPHPVAFFAPDVPAFRLTPHDERALLLDRFGVDQLLVLEFNKELSAMAADDFIKTILVDALGARHISVGYDYRFGKGRVGDTDLLQQTGQEYGFTLRVVEPVTVGVEGYGGDVYSSTLVRNSLKAGEARKAAALLGHWWMIKGEVQKGDQLGRTIDFPTANIELGESIEPMLGVYAVRVKLEGDDTLYSGVANIGKRPTFDKRDVRLEVYLFDFDRDIYGCQARVELVSHVRSEQKFDGIDALKTQITRDVETARHMLADPENDRNRLSLPTLDEYLKRFPQPYSE